MYCTVQYVRSSSLTSEIALTKPLKTRESLASFSRARPDKTAEAVRQDIMNNTIMLKSIVAAPTLKLLYRQKRFYVNELDWCKRERLPKGRQTLSRGVMGEDVSENLD